MSRLAICNFFDSFPIFLNLDILLKIRNEQCLFSCQRPILVLETDRKYVQLLETKGPNESFHSKLLKLLQTFIFQLEI